MEKTKTCLHRVFGGRKECENCTRNYDPNNHPNNHDCSNYYEISMWTFDVSDEIKRGETQDALDRKI